ncbi:type II CAAX endopeptidase family protein [Actinoplanes sp. NPDC051861]|uniref:CPBP family intramembrane glutamic endopeptidase n=1 Tax=Actinoplanes sp. NPDC051861 TaxID=3155170 RepID=UPI00344AC811
MNSLESGHLRRRFLEFSAFCLALTWIPWFVLGACDVNLDEGAGSLVFGLAASGPSFAALAMFLRHRRETRPVADFRRWAGWAAGAVLSGAFASVAAAVLLNAADLSVIADHAGSTIADVGGPLAALMFTFLAGPVAEEFGWRGYLQPRLRQSHGRVLTTVVLATGWAIWHLPLFFLEGTGQQEMRGLLFFLELFPLTYLMLFVTEHLRGGVPAAILAHAAWNFSDAVLPSLDTGGQWLRLTILTLAAVASAAWWRGREGRAGGRAFMSWTTSPSRGGADLDC